jgi:CheY-like chemotaxis protein
MDLGLAPGGMDGYETTAIIRRQVGTGGAHVPIVAMTGSVTDDERARCTAAKMQGFLPKPIQREDVARAIELYADSW